MSYQETMDRVFSDMIATSRGGVVVSIPNRAGKSTIHRQMQHVDKAPKKNDDFQIIVDEWRDTPQDWREWDCIKRYTRKEIEDMLTPNPIELPKGDA